jgi:hypothetical protein
LAAVPGLALGQPDAAEIAETAIISPRGAFPDGLGHAPAQVAVDDRKGNGR